jgi:signal transduction histidine kinase/response regulator RpfG family c-di-GMP phosphodiesterase
MVARDTKKQKILVVDDEPDNLDLLYRTFHREFKVLRAENGPDALNILEREGDIAVIISDQRMPQMSGTEFLSLTAQRYPDIIRIILTGYTDVEDLVEAINSGKVFKYVTKPWDDEQLKQVVRQATDTHNVLRKRTEELRRNLRRETLLNAVTGTLRSALSYRELLQSIAGVVGQTLEVTHCILRPYSEGQFSDETVIYQAPLILEGSEAEILPNDCTQVVSQVDPISKMVWQVSDILELSASQLVDAFRIQGLDDQSLFSDLKTVSALMVPLFCQQELVAVLSLYQADGDRVWQSDEIELVGMVADQAALALAQAQAYERVRALAKREVLVNTITTAIRSSLDPQEIFSSITSQLGEALQVDGCTLSLWKAEDRYVQCVGLYDADTAVHGESQAENQAENLLHALPKSQVLIEDNPVLLHLLKTQEPVALHDLAHHPEFQTPDFQTPAKALLVLPMLSEGKIIGSISLRQNNQIRYWTQSEIRLVQSVAEQAAIAVQQANLYQTTRLQAEQLIAVDRAKTEFFQNISHEFRTPLTLMLGPLETAVSQKLGLSCEQAAIALRSSRRLLRLVNQLLDLQRLDAGQMQTRFQSCDLADFIHQIVETFRAYCEKKGIALVANLEPIAAVYLDSEKFDKVVYNLLSNAMKFTPHGGTITVTLRSIAQGQVLFQVQDTGIGIREDQLPVLFERFRQAEGSANRSYEGTGLGLSLVKELVEIHSGQIQVSSVYGEGSTFAVTLPIGCDHLSVEQILDEQGELQVSRAMVELADLDAELQTIESEELVVNDLVDSKSQCILVVEDTADLRTYIAGILRGQGYRVIMARNGEEGFQMAQQHKPHLILTDLMMPKVSGLDLIRMVRLDEGMCGTPIVLLTAKADEDTRLEGVERGADAYLSKPFSDRLVIAEVRNLLALKEKEQRVVELNEYLTESVLKRFLPPSLVKRAATGNLSLDLRPEPKMVTVLFSDIVGFTQLSNTLRSKKVAEILNEYLAEMTRAVFQNGGTVDKFMGDAILALYGAPEELTPNEQIRRSIATARDMHASLDVLNAKWMEQGLPKLEFRCGIHQGTAVVGMFGGADRSDYTAVGPSVNIAARLQTAALPGQILVSAAVADYLEEEEITKGESLHLKGIDETVLTFWVDPMSAKVCEPSLIA